MTGQQAELDTSLRAGLEEVVDELRAAIGGRVTAPVRTSARDATIRNLVSLINGLLDARRSDEASRAVIGHGAIEPTGRACADQMLEAERALLADIIANIPFFVFWKDRDSIIRGCNHAFARIMGAQRSEDVVGKSDFDFACTPEQAEAFRCDDARVMESGQPALNIEERLRRPDGSEATLLTSKVPLRDAAGSVIGVLGIFADITERKRMEETLAERTRLLALGGVLAQSMNEPTSLREMLQRAAELINEYMDAAFVRIWTLNPGEHVLELDASAGMYTHINGGHRRVRVGDLKIGRIAATREPHLTNSVQTDPHTSDPEWARREGMVAFGGYPLLIEGDLVGVMAMFARHALSESAFDALETIANRISLGIVQKRALEVLQLRDAALSAAADAVVITDTKGVIQWTNPAFTRLTGFEAHDTIGRTPRILKSDQHDAAFYRQLWQTISRGNVWQGEIINRRKDGTLYPEYMTVTPVRATGKEVSHFIAIKQDATERKRHEEDQILRVRLEQERNSLRSAIDAHEKVLGVVGHELRTPIAGVRAMAEYLLRADARGTPEFDEFLVAIHDQVIRMGDTVSDLLEAARLNSGRARWNWGDVRLHAVCADAADAVCPLIDESRVRLTVEVPQDGLEMRGDADAIRRLMINLLTNSQKHTPAGTITLRAWGATEDGVAWITLEVEDTGEGMPPEIAARIGEAFALNAGVVGGGHVSGTGLGLAICRGIAAAHGGSITVRTAVGRGTTMRARVRADLVGPVKRHEAADITQEEHHAHDSGC